MFFNVGESISETTPFIEGPSDTSEMYTGNLFRSTLLRENIVESTGPVLSFTLQVPQAAIRSTDPVVQPGNLKLVRNLSVAMRPVTQEIYRVVFMVITIHNLELLDDLISQL